MKIFKYLNISILKHSGFTLIELLVAVSIFTIVTVFAIAALLNLANVNDQAQALLTALNNLDFAVDHMGRTIRLGKNYRCDPACDPNQGTDNLRFIDSIDHDGDGVRDDWIEYRLIPAVGDGYGYVQKKNFSKNTTFAITSPEINIADLTFFVLTDDPTKQPRVLVLINGRTRVADVAPEEQDDFNIQTSLSEQLPVE